MKHNLRRGCRSGLFVGIVGLLSCWSSATEAKVTIVSGHHTGYTSCSVQEVFDKGNGIDPPKYTPLASDGYSYDEHQTTDFSRALSASVEYSDFSLSSTSNHTIDFEENFIQGSIETDSQGSAIRPDPTFGSLSKQAFPYAQADSEIIFTVDRPTVVELEADTFDPQSRSVVAVGIVTEEGEHQFLFGFASDSYSYLNFTNKGIAERELQPGSSYFLWTRGGSDINTSDRKSQCTFKLSFDSSAINQAPSFTKGPDQSVAKNTPDDIKSVTIENWATNISPGPVSEASQTVEFLVTSNNSDLFSIQPAISPDGTLTFTPAPDKTGSATVTVRLKDSGGTANGGQDTSAEQTFTITVGAEKADLVGEKIVVLGGRVSVNVPFDVFLTVRNIGQGEGGDFQAKIYLSKDEVIDPNTDVYIGSQTGGSLDPDETTRLLFEDVTLPEPLPEEFWGTVTIGAVIDSANAVDELDESNNMNRGFLLDKDTSVSLFDPVWPVTLYPSASNPRVFPSRTAASLFLMRQGFYPNLGNNQSYDPGWSKELSSPTYSRFNGKMMPPAAYRIHASVTDKAPYRIVIQGVWTVDGGGNIRAVRGEPNPYTALYLTLTYPKWLRYAYDYHVFF